MMVWSVGIADYVVSTVFIDACVDVVVHCCCVWVFQWNVGCVVSSTLK